MFPLFVIFLVAKLHLILGLFEGGLLKGAIRIYYVTHRGVGGNLLFVTKCDKGWVGCFWNLMSHF